MDKVVHFGIPVNDLERAKKFYTDIFGWNARDIPDLEYTILQTVNVDDDSVPTETGAINGGMWVREKGDETPIIVMQVNSVDDYLQKIEKKGGEMIMDKQIIGDIGYYAKFKDPEGNIMGLWEIMEKIN